MTDAVRLRASDKGVVFDMVYRPNGFLDRARGLIGRPELGVGECMFFKNCNAVHMCFMTRSIDIFFLDEGYAVTKVVQCARIFGFYRDAKARHALECRAGAAATKGIEKGTIIIPEEF
ncbi:DUF192 domain-containing protein [uncultured Gilvimarinus sp.]|uniref:DUF192 domain-containing protein n=1 Tax=uncultured Gilvimarinus sp. TaxID=1689143 RepID=UPI0030EE4C9E|tara:strand:- start:2832 stop:3185 length:354 start_codon:yes stop_codon:yes gene_type:complete